MPWTKHKVAEVDLVAVGNIEGDGGASTLDPTTLAVHGAAPESGVGTIVVDIGIIES